MSLERGRNRLRTVDGGTIDEKQTLLLDLWQMERASETTIDPSLLPEAEVESHSCWVKLHEMSGMIEYIPSLSHAERFTFILECESRLIHFHKRILHLPRNLQSELFKFLLVVKVN